LRCGGLAHCCLSRLCDRDNLSCSRLNLYDTPFTCSNTLRNSDPAIQLSNRFSCASLQNLKHSLLCLCMGAYPSFSTQTSTRGPQVSMRPLMLQRKLQITAIYQCSRQRIHPLLTDAQIRIDYLRPLWTMLLLSDLLCNVKGAINHSSAFNLNSKTQKRCVSDNRVTDLP
jgi:hypothetical protein